jgi:hypothetical protein
VNEEFSKDNEFLLPANGTFIALSLFVALMLNWLPWQGLWLAVRPDSQHWCCSTGVPTNPIA